MAKLQLIKQNGHSWVCFFYWDTLYMGNWVYDRFTHFHLKHLDDVTCAWTGHMILKLPPRYTGPVVSHTVVQ